MTIHSDSFRMDKLCMDWAWIHSAPWLCNWLSLQHSSYTSDFCGEYLVSVLWLCNCGFLNERNEPKRLTGWRQNKASYLICVVEAVIHEPCDQRRLSNCKRTKRGEALKWQAFTSRQALRHFGTDERYRASSITQLSRDLINECKDDQRPDNDAEECAVIIMMTGATSLFWQKLRQK